MGACAAGDAALGAESSQGDLADPASGEIENSAGIVTTGSRATGRSLRYE
jgi:hypothetical protein